MFKDKEKRDNVLLVVMAVVTVLFILYLVFPITPAREQPPTVKNSHVQPGHEDKKSVVTMEDPMAGFKEINQKFALELEHVFQRISTRTDTFTTVSTKNLRRLFTVIGRNRNIMKQYPDLRVSLEKMLKYSVYDLKDMLLLPFPEICSGDFRFNLYLSLFLIKIQEERVIQRITRMSLREYGAWIDLSPFQMVGLEIEQDYQTLPILFHYEQLLKKLDLYAVNSQAAFFLELLQTCKDLTPSKWIVRIRELLTFNIELDRYRIHWTEYDRLNPNDSEEFTNLQLRTYTFLKQRYLVFPDRETPGNNGWLQELCRTDSGNIELIDFGIQGEVPYKNLGLKKILYAPMHSRFYIILTGEFSVANESYPDYIVDQVQEVFNQNFTRLVFFQVGDEKKALKEALLSFGHYLFNTFRTVNFTDK